MEEVAISLSGGGFRAAMFHLGTLSYLNHLKLPDGRSFLDIVNTISTISGGTITGLWYIMNYCKGKNTDDSVRELYSLLTTCDLPTDMLRSYLKKDNDNPSIIKEMIKMYDDVFFHGQTFGMIMDKADKGHIHHFSANGTDFSTGYAFRFQASRCIKNTKPEYRYGYIGNNAHRISRDIAAKIRLSEILAVSSCFPGGFEPVIYPDDFSFFKQMDRFSDWPETERFNLMDGGIVDNQGIEPVLLANKQMSYDHPYANGDKNYPCHDLIIISDVSSSNVKTQKPSNTSSMYSKLNTLIIEKVLNLCLAAFTILSIILYVQGLSFFLGISLTLTLSCFALRLGLVMIEKKIKKKLDERVPFPYNWKQLKRLTFSRLMIAGKNRLCSLLDLAQAVFMKPIRQMRYDSLYQDPKWKNRLISNIISETSSNGSWRKKGSLPKELIPSTEMKINSNKACSMGTTLWFTEKDKKEGIPEALFTTGQYTICMNLLEYISKLEKDNSNINSSHKLIMGCKEQLLDDWNEFQHNPQFMLRKAL